MFGLSLNIKCQCNYECLFLEMLFNQIRHVYSGYKIISCMTGYEKYTVHIVSVPGFFRVFAERRHSVTFSMYANHFYPVLKLF